MLEDILRLIINVKLGDRLGAIKIPIQSKLEAVEAVQDKYVVMNETFVIGTLGILV